MMSAIALQDKSYEHAWVVPATSFFYFHFMGCQGAMVALADRPYGTIVYEFVIGYENTHTILRRYGRYIYQ